VPAGEPESDFAFNEEIRSREFAEEIIRYMFSIPINRPLDRKTADFHAI
jgi:hypothetical protein